MKHYDFTKEKGVVDVAAIHGWIDKVVKYLMNGGYTITITKVVKKRTLSQNRLMWMWFKCMEDDSGQSSQDWHDYYCKKLLGREFVTPKGEVTILSGHTSTMNTAQMTDFLNKVQADAATEWGITLPTPDDLAWEEFEAQFKEYAR